MASLRLEHIYKVYPNGTKAVSDFTMNIADQEFIVFVGPSGCGKSTTLRMIAGLEEISAGELYIGDTIMNEVEPKDRDIAMVFQNYALYPHMTVYENMAFGLQLRHVPANEIHEKVLWAAKILDLVEYLDRKPRAMSGGQRQRVALGRAILRNPKVMLLDEPLSNLDAKLRAQMRSEIAKLHEELKTTFIYVTHDQVEAMTLGTRVVVMKLGRIMQVDTPKNLYDYPENLFVAGFIGTPQMNFFNVTLKKTGDNVDIDFLDSKNSITVKHSLLSKVQHQYFDGVKKVVLGLRCEDLSLDPEVVKESNALIDVKVSHFEELGNETLIYVDLNLGHSSVIDNNTTIIVKANSSLGLHRGDIVKIALKPEKMHLFDKETEQTINPRLPESNLATATIKNHTMELGSLSYKLPLGLNVEDGNYDVIIPSSALDLNMDGIGNPIQIDDVEKIGNKNLVRIVADTNLLYKTMDEDVNLDSKWSLDIDFTKIAIRNGDKVIVDALPEYDRVDGIFINHVTAKSFVGDKFQNDLDCRVKACKDKYEPIADELKAKYDAECAKHEGEDHTDLALKNKEIKEAKKQEINDAISKLKSELDVNIANSKSEHKKLLNEIQNNVNTSYAKVMSDEIEAFDAFKRINKDKDIYRTRLQEFRDFKANQALEKQNEMSKRLNLESVRYDSEVNALKSNFKREKLTLKKKYTDLVAELTAQEKPIEVLTKKYKSDLKVLNSHYNEDMKKANILFFFKISNLILKSSDAISNKMIQGLGIKVFTKQYLIDIPHDAYILDEDGLECKVIEVLDYDKKRYLKCELNDGVSTKTIYILTDGKYEKNSIIKVTIDINKVHITEKNMDIKIY